MAGGGKDKPNIQVGNQPVTVQLLDDRLRGVALTIGIMIIVAGGVGALYIVWPVIEMIVRTAVPFAVGLVFAYIFNPIVTFVQRRLHLSLVGGVLFLYFLFLLAITGFFAILLPILITQVRSAWVGISGFMSEQLDRLGSTLAASTTAEGEPVKGTGLAFLWEQVRLWLEARGVIVEDLFSQAAASERMREAARSAATSGVRVVGDAVTFFLSVLLTVFGSVAFVVFAILVNIYLLIDFSKLRDVMEVLIPDQHEKRTFEVLAKVDVAVGGFIRGMLIDAFLVGLLTFLGLWVLGLKEYALLIGVIAGFGNLIPYMGGISGALPALLYVAFSDSYDSTNERLLYAGGVLLLTVIVQGLEGLVFQPKIVGKAAQLHPIAVLFALALGANFGLIGMILAVPAACIARVLLKEFFWDRRESQWKKTTGKRFLGDWHAKKARKGSA